MDVSLSEIISKLNRDGWICIGISDNVINTMKNPYLPVEGAQFIFLKKFNTLSTKIDRDFSKHISGVLYNDQYVEYILHLGKKICNYRIYRDGNSHNVESEKDDYEKTIADIMSDKFYINTILPTFIEVNGSCNITHSKKYSLVKIEDGFDGCIECKDCGGYYVHHKKFNSYYPILNDMANELLLLEDVNIFEDKIDNYIMTYEISYLFNTFDDVEDNY